MAASEPSKRKGLVEGFSSAHFLTSCVVGRTLEGFVKGIRGSHLRTVRVSLKVCIPAFRNSKRPELLTFRDFVEGSFSHAAGMTYLQSVGTLEWVSLKGRVADQFRVGTLEVQGFH